jgi:type I restriction enzyme S subunit
MSGLPSGWASAPLGSFTVNCSQRVPEEIEKFSYIDIASINRETKRIETPQQLVGKDAPSRARKHVRAGDTLVSMTRPNLNAVAFVPDTLDGAIASNGFDVLRTPGLDSRWVFYLVRTAAFVDAMSELVQGALYPAVKSNDVRSFVAPLAPPLNEQKRIADKLDAVLARVVACRARLDRVPPILKRFRQAVLAAATSGTLTEEWRESNASFEWNKKKVGELYKLIDGDRGPN